MQRRHGEKSMVKSFTIAPQYRGIRLPGQIPGQGGPASLERLLDMPKPPKVLAILDHNEPRLTLTSVVSGLGLPLAEESDWRNWLSRNLESASNEVVARKALFGRFIEHQTPPELRKALFQRAMSYYGCMLKSVVQIVTPDELLEKGGWKDKLPGGLADKKTPADFDPKKLATGAREEREHTKDPHIATEIAMDQMTADPHCYDHPEKDEKRKDSEVQKGEPLGGSYYRRVPNEKGDGHRYFYDPEKYHAREDAHVDGEDALKKRLHKMCLSHVTEAGDTGCDHKTFQALASRFGASKVADVLREATADGGPMVFEKGTFKLRAPLKKSERFTIKG